MPINQTPSSVPAEPQTVDHTQGVLKFHAGQIAVALHFVDIAAHPIAPQGKVFRSFESDLLAYQFQVDPPVRSFTHKAMRLQVSFAQSYVYHSEDAAFKANRRAEPIAIDVKLCCSEFRASGLRVWHVVIVPANENGAYFDEYDILALIHLYDGRSEDTHFRETLRFVSHDDTGEKRFGAGELLRSLKGRAAQLRGDAALRDSDLPDREAHQFLAGTIQMNLPDGDDLLLDLLAKAYDARKSKGDGPAGKGRPLGALETMHKKWKDSRNGNGESRHGDGEPWQKLLAFAGIVVGIFDFEEVDVEELVESISPSFSDGRIFIQINRCTLLAVTQADRVMGADPIKRDVGISPYLLLPHAVVLHNETLVRIADASLDQIRAHVRAHRRSLRGTERVRRLFGLLKSKPNPLDTGGPALGTLQPLEELERMLERATRTLGELQLPNLFNYVTERTIFDQAMAVRGSRDKHSAVSAKRLDVREQIELLWKLRAERGQNWLAAIAVAFSMIPLRTFFKEVLHFNDSDSALLALGVAFVFFLIVLYVRDRGLRKQRLFDE